VNATNRDTLSPLWYLVALGAAILGGIALAVLDQPWNDYVVYALGTVQVILLAILVVLVVRVRRKLGRSR
jgi:hypothetical protein